MLPKNVRDMLHERRFQRYLNIDDHFSMKDRIVFYRPTIESIFMEAKLDPFWGLGMAMQESLFRSTRPALTGGDGERGGSYGLLMVSALTAESMGFKGQPIDLCIPETGVLWATKVILRNMHDYNITDFRDVLACYNSGKRFTDAPQLTRSVYVPKALQYASQFRSGKSFA